MLKATATASVPLDSLSQRMPAGNFLVSAVFQLFHFLHAFLSGHTLTDSGFLLLFSIKSKEERSCFAEIVINGRIPYFRRALFWRTCAQSVWSTAFSVAGYKKKIQDFLLYLSFWLRRQDLNPRATLMTYTLSRGTSSASWVLLRCYIYNSILN